MVTLESIQSWLTDLSSLLQFVGAVLGLCAIVLPLLRTLPCYHSVTYWLDVFLTLLFHTFSRTFYLISFSGSSIEELHQDPLTICLSASSDSRLISGLSNTGNTCYLNSVLQAVSSLPGLHLYLDKAKSADSPVTNTLYKTIRRISKPQSSRSSVRPSELVSALAATTKRSNGTRRRYSSFLMNREQQDAQEFFQVLMDALDTESQRSRMDQSPANMDGDGLRDLLLPPFSPLSATETASLALPSPKYKSLVHSPLTGLLASRLSCVQCGYTGAIRHFSFNNIQLCLPNAYSVTIEQCLEQYTAIEYLRDATCRQCSLLTTNQIINDQVRSLKRQAKKAFDNKEKRRHMLTQLVHLEKERMRLEQRLRTKQIDSSDDDDVEADKRDPQLSDRRRYYKRTISPRSTKQVMIAKPPSLLCLHMTRSAMHQSSGMIFKNTCQLIFDEYLDLSPYVTDGTLYTQATTPLSSSIYQDRSTTYDKQHMQQSRSSSYLYRLMSAVVHYGSHNYGHYIAYKRRILPSHCQCHTCSKNHISNSSKQQTLEQTSNSEEQHTLLADSRHTLQEQNGNDNDQVKAESWDQCATWYRISDSKVDTCTLDDVLASNPYMLFYERVDPASEDEAYLSIQQQRRSDTERLSSTYDDSETSDITDDSSVCTYSSDQGQTSKAVNEGDENDDDDSNSDNHHPISPATPLDGDDNDFTSYYSELTGTSLEALEMANRLFTMDRQEESSSGVNS